jgi:hypothetical protein
MTVLRRQGGDADRMGLKPRVILTWIVVQGRDRSTGSTAAPIVEEENT